MSDLSGYEPRGLWMHFEQILTIPRGSGNEDAMRQYVLEVAERNGLESRVDGVGNVVVRKPGTAGNESSPGTVLQGHLDMVNEKNSDVDHDFDRDPIRTQRDGEYLKATGTTLGADNGIGVAAMLAVMEADDLIHGPLEFLFTIDEETGLTGAAGLETDLLQGRRLLNLDSEEEGELTIGCAGGADSHLYLDLDESAPGAGSAAFEVRVAGLKGGHSGIDAHRQRGNAVKVLARALYSASLTHPLRISEFLGGDKHNAIPRESRALVAVPDGAAAKDARDAVYRELEAVHDEIRSEEPGMTFVVSDVAVPAVAWDEATTNRFLALIGALPHGVVAMSYDIDGLVETSTNLAAVKRDGKRLSILMSSRSSIASALTALRQRIRAVASLAGAEVEEDAGYPGWKPDVDSPILELVKQQHEEVFGKRPEVGAIHAGLECGIIGEKFPGMDMISFGPQIEFPHSPDERVHVDSVGRFYELLGSTLRSLV